MPVTISIPAPLRQFAGGQSQITVEAKTAGEALDLLTSTHAPLRRHLYELPAGKIEAGEEPLVTAQRELLEECGYTAKSWRHLTTLHPCVGYSDERIELFLARDLEHQGAALDDGEFLEVLPMAIDDVRQRVRDGHITDVKVTAGLAWLEWLKR